MDLWILIFLEATKLNCDVIILTETWHSNNDTSNFSIPSYDSFFSYRKINKCDGVAIYVRSCLNARVSPADIKGANASLLTFDHGQKNKRLLAIYRPPSENEMIFNQSLANYIDNLNSNEIIKGPSDSSWRASCDSQSWTWPIRCMLKSELRLPVSDKANRMHVAKRATRLPVWD